MAVTGSGLFIPTFRDALDTSNLAIDMLAVTHKLALFNDSITPNFDTDTAYAVAPYNGNEVSGGSWPSGGPTLSVAAVGGTSTTPTFALGNAGQLKYDMLDVEVATTTLNAAMCAVLYADGVASPTAKPVICLVDFVTAANTGNGTFKITWDALGVFTIDLVP